MNFNHLAGAPLELIEAHYRQLARGERYAGRSGLCRLERGFLRFCRDVDAKNDNRVTLRHLKEGDIFTLTSGGGDFIEAVVDSEIAYITAASQLDVGDVLASAAEQQRRADNERVFDSLRLTEHVLQAVAFFEGFTFDGGQTLHLNVAELARSINRPEPCVRWALGALMNETRVVRLSTGELRVADASPGR